MKTILIVEDDAAIRAGLEDALAAEHFNVLSASDGIKGYTMAKRENIDLVILDLMLPERNGQEICRDLRKEGINTPILMLTSKNQEMDKVLGLELGADDYMTKPFSIRELIARIHALLRRNRDIARDVEEYSFADIEIDFKKQEAPKNKKTLKLSSREFDILKYFVRREGEVVTREMLLDDVWGYENFPTTRTIDNFILGLRKKIEDNHSHPKHLLTVHTSGYKFVK